ncbi:MAG: hypothetical protein R3281_13900 [Balneolaceae bacterium]|nr:hypothetical protein [Balneolaceae bacterium]
MKKVLGIFGISLLAVAVFFVPGQEHYIWWSVAGAISIAILFWIGLLIYTLRQSDSPVVITAVFPLILLQAGITAYLGIFSYQAAEWQHQSLMDTRESRASHCSRCIHRSLSNH